MSLLAQMRLPQLSLCWLLIIVCGLLMVVILLQRGRGGGLAGAFGGSGGSSAFGAKTGDVFTWITVIMASVFLLLAVAGNFVLDQSSKSAEAAPPSSVPLPPAPEAPVTRQSFPISVDPVDVTATPTLGGEATDTGSQDGALGAESPPDAETPPDAVEEAGQGDEERPNP